MLAVFVAPNDNVPADAVIQAACAARAIQTWATERAAPDGTVSVRTSVGFGPLDLIALGGDEDAAHSLFAGDSVRQAARYNTSAQPGQVVLSAAAFRVVDSRCRGTTLS